MRRAPEYGPSGGRSALGPTSLRLVAALMFTVGACKAEPAVPPEQAPPTAASGLEQIVPAEPSAVELEPKQQMRERPAPKPVTSLPAALEAVTHGNPEGAADYLTPYVGDHPKDVTARLALARALASVGRYEQALATLGTGGSGDEDVVRARVLVLRRLGRLRDARSTLDDALKHTPASIALRGDLLEVLVQSGEGETPAAKQLMESLYDEWDAGRVEQPKHFLAVAKATLARGSTSAFDDANWVLDQAERAASVAEGTWIADRIVLLRGAMFVEKYRPDEAAETFGLLLERNPWDADALAGMAIAQYSALQFAAASRSAREALQVNPKHADAHAVLAKVALIEGRRGQAERHAVDEALAVNPGHAGGLAAAAAGALMRADTPAFERWRDRALAHNPRHARFFAELADLLGFLHLYEDLDGLLADASRRLPKDPYVNSALGINLLRLGREKPALEALARAWARDEYNERTANVLELYDKRIKQHYVDVQIGGLSLRLPRDGHELVAPGLAASIERARAALDGHYDTKAGGLRLEFYATPKDFSVRTTGVTSLGAAAVCFGRVITFTGPYLGTHNIDQVIWHELAHVYAIDRSGGRVPRWFTEGLSEWESELANPAWARESAELLVAARRYDKLRRMDELELAFMRAESPRMMEVAYSTAAYAVRYLGETYGRPKLIAMLDAWGAGKSTGEVFTTVLGKDVSAVANGFETWFFAALDRKVSGWEPSTSRRAKPSKLDELFAKAQQQVGDKQLDEATRTLERLIADGGDGYHPRMMLAGILSDGPRPAGAVRHIERARAFHVEATEPLMLLAHLARRAGKTDEEKRHLAEVLRIDSQGFGPAARLLMLGLVTNDARTTTAALTQARAIAPLHPMTLSAGAYTKAKSEPAAGRKLLERAFPALQGGKGPGETYVVAAMAAKAVGETEIAKIFVTHARNDPDLPAEAKAVLDRI